jgi:hypothetical protein
MRKLFRAQIDLFVIPLRPAELTGVERQTAVALLQTLLREALVTPAGEVSNPQEKDAGDVRSRRSILPAPPSYMCVSRLPIRWSTILRASGANMVWWSGRGISSMTISVGLAGRPGRGSRNCWLRFVRAGSAQWYHWKRRAWLGTVVIGIHCWSSAVWSAHSLSTKKLSTTRVRPTTGCCWA